MRPGPFVGVSRRRRYTIRNRPRFESAERASCGDTGAGRGRLPFRSAHALSAVTITALYRLGYASARGSTGRDAAYRSLFEIHPEWSRSRRACSPRFLIPFLNAELIRLPWASGSVRLGRIYASSDAIESWDLWERRRAGCSSACCDCGFASDAGVRGGLSSKRCVGNSVICSGLGPCRLLRYSEHPLRRSWLCAGFDETSRRTTEEHEPIDEGSTGEREKMDICRKCAANVTAQGRYSRIVGVPGCRRTGKEVRYATAAVRDTADGGHF